MEKREVARKAMKGFAKMTLDFTFKKVFGQEADKRALIAFLNRMIGDVEINQVRLLPTERLGMTSVDRKAIFDVACETKDGTEFIVEMQCAKQKYFRDRALYYAGYPLVEQGRRALENFASGEGPEAMMAKGRWDYNLKPVIFVAVLNYVMEHHEGWPHERYHSSYRIREDIYHEVMNEKLRFIFLELGRFDKGPDELLDANDKWMYALKHMHEFQTRPEELNENEFDSLFNLAKIANFTPDEMNSYLDELLMDNDYWNTIDYAKEEAMKEGREQGFGEGFEQGRVAGLAKGHAEGHAEGYAEGHAEGHEEGHEEGYYEGKIEIAKNMLAAGMTVEQICEFTNLPDDVIETL